MLVILLYCVVSIVNEEKYKDEINTLYEQLRRLDTEYAERQNTELMTEYILSKNYEANKELAKEYNAE